jgi:hypothetical protein
MRSADLVQLKASRVVVAISAWKQVKDLVDSMLSLRDSEKKAAKTITANETTFAAQKERAAIHLVKRSACGGAKQ